MTRSRALAGALALAVLAGGCGMSTTEQTKPRVPAGQGETRGPDVSVESLDELRTVEVVVNRGRFQPQQVSVGLDSTVRIQNEDDKVARLRKLTGPGGAIRDPILDPGEQAELDFLDTGNAVIALQGENGRLTINVYP